MIPVLLGQRHIPWACLDASLKAINLRHLHATLRLQDWRETVSLPPGSSLIINANSSNVHLKAGGAIDFATIKGSHASLASAWGLDYQPGSVKRPVLRLSELHGSPQGTLTVTLPDKWVTVHVSTHGGDVHVAKVTEANLRVSSQGGKVVLGSIRAVEVDIQTGGGALTASEMSGTTVAVLSDGGDVSIKRLLGQDVRLHTKGGLVDIGAMYGDNIDVDSGGKSITVATMDCSADVKLASQGGAIAINSIDGNAHLDSSGGPIQLHLHRNIGTLKTRSYGGDVDIALSPDAVVTVTAEGTKPILGDGDFMTNGQQQTARFQPPTEPVEGRGVERRHRSSAIHGGDCVVDAGGGQITITRLRWADAVRARLAKLQQTAK